MDNNQNTGYFQEVLLDPPGDPKRLAFVMVKGAGSEPDELRALRAKLDQTARAVAIFFKDDKETRRDFMLQLRKIADVGCRGPGYSVAFGESGLENLKQEVVDLAEEKKNTLQRKYLLAMLCIAVPGVLLRGGFIIRWPILWLSSLFDIINDPKSIQSIIVAMWLMPAGAAFGVWLEFALRAGKIDFDRLLFFDTERWHLSSRMAITIGLAMAFAFLFFPCRTERPHMTPPFSGRTNAGVRTKCRRRTVPIPNTSRFSAPLPERRDPVRRMGAPVFAFRQMIA